MGSHIGAIGLPADAADFSETIRQLAERATPLGSDERAGVRVYGHADASGSYATITIESDVLTCFTPGLRQGRIVSGVCGELLENECRYERPLVVDATLGDMETPLAVTVDDLGISEPTLVAGQPIRLEIAALAEQLIVFEDEGAYRASGTPMAVESLIPSGLFAPGRVSEVSHRASSRMLMSGTLVEAERLRHSVFGGAFVVLAIRSLGDEWRVAVDPADVGGADADLPRAGSIVSGTFWLSGHRAS